MHQTQGMDSEHALIMRLFVQPSYSKRVWCGVGDDAAVLHKSAQSMVMTTDALIQGTHFLPDSAADDIAYKAVLTSLSDIAAMGASGQSILLSLSLPKVNLTWLEQFSFGLMQAIKCYQLDLIGGNLARGPLSVHTFMQGVLPLGRSPLLQHTMAPGDAIYVTAPLGGAAFGLQQYRLGRADTLCHEAFWRPKVSPGFALGLHGIASACFDVSDGLWCDLCRVSQRSGYGMIIDTAAVPRHCLLQTLTDQAALALALSGGEDYPLCFTVAKNKFAQLNQLAEKMNQAIYCIGHVSGTKSGVILTDKLGQAFEPYWTNWEHFDGI